MQRSANVPISNIVPKANPPRGINRLLAGHEECVKAVAFLPSTTDDQSNYLISGSDDKTVIVWEARQRKITYQKLQRITEHEGAINCISTLRLKQNEPSWLVATGSADASIKLWSFTKSQLSLLQSLVLKPKLFPLTLALCHLDTYANTEHEVVALAAAGTRNTVQIFTADASAQQLDFTLEATLAGHEGWIRSLSFTPETSDPNSDILLASASQDKYVRIWRFHQGATLPISSLESTASSAVEPTSMPGNSPAGKAHWLKVADKQFCVTFEALLLGHEDWIYSAQWNLQDNGKLRLLSTSADNSLAIWEADPGSGIWISTVRLGEISREKGATTATGSTGGFWTGLWAPGGNSVVCLGRTGSWRRWQYSEVEDVWKPCVAVSGHFKAVTGISWSKDGRYLLSSSSDQTTRLHMPWATSGSGSWHEASRPQIHGYDLNCVDSIGPTCFVSGADEKLMRVFSLPKAVASLLSRLDGKAIEGAEASAMPDAANMPVLGLSNKAVDVMDDGVEHIQPTDMNDRQAVDTFSVVKGSHLDITHPPFEETLSRHTLWPETEKLYGHGYEISCLAASHDGKVVASACKASSTNHAVIRLFETDHWTEIRPPLTAHSLTTTRLRFSADDKYLLSVGRDRQWIVFRRGEEDHQQYSLLQANPKGHSRMILDAAWAPTTGPMFATAGRDKQVRVWRSNTDNDTEMQFAQTASFTCENPVTAVDFWPRQLNNLSVLALGTETGLLNICTLTDDGVLKNQLLLNSSYVLQIIFILHL